MALGAQGQTIEGGSATLEKCMRLDDFTSDQVRRGGMR